MIGSIQSEERCRLCGSKFKDNGRALICPNHPKETAHRHFKINFKTVWKRARTYDEAARILNGLRYKFDEGSFDARDYRRDEPLGFENLSGQWLGVKQHEVKRKSYNNIRNYMSKAGVSFGNRNIKTIGYAELEDFLVAQSCASKTRADMRSCLHSFWTWLRRRRILRPDQIPEFPTVSFELGFRKLISPETQEAVLEEIHRISYHINPKVWLGVKWCMTYPNTRPGEFISILEEHINLDTGTILIPHPKEKKSKLIPLIHEDWDLLRTMPRGFPKHRFFRHAAGISGVKAGKPFGEKYFYKWWVKACGNLGIEGVDLYGGTRHSTVTRIGDTDSPETAREASGHSTSKAFDRYRQLRTERLREIYEEAAGERASKNRLNMLDKKTGRSD